MKQITDDAVNAFVNDKKFMKSNTRVSIDVENNTTALFLFENKIAEKINGHLYITNAGWRSVTTKERLNGLPGVSIHQKKGEWYLNGHKWNGDWVRVDTFTGNKSESESKKERAMLKKIKEYSNLYKNKDLYPLLPDSGDCWFCCMTTEKKQSLGDATDNNEHLLSHIEEQYAHGSMIVNALRESGYRDEQIGIFLHGFSTDNVQRAVYKYMKKRLTKLAN